MKYPTFSIKVSKVRTYLRIAVIEEIAINTVQMQKRNDAGRKPLQNHVGQIIWPLESPGCFLFAWPADGGYQGLHNTKMPKALTDQLAKTTKSSRMAQI